MRQARIHEILGLVESKSKPGSFHQVKRDFTNGAVWCDCMAWRFSKTSPKTCRHIAGLQLIRVA